MPREVTVALVQMAPELANPEANLRKMGDFIEKICTEQRTDLIVFPELSYTGTELGLKATDLAERVPGHATNYLAKRANEFNTYVVFGMVVKEKVESILYNGVVCLGPEGDVVADYRKVHLLGEERQVYRNGFRFQIIDAEWGRFGLSIGTDLAFPEAARGMTLDGAELVTVSANWEQQYAESWRVYLVSRAVKTRSSWPRPIASAKSQRCASWATACWSAPRQRCTPCSIRPSKGTRSLLSTSIRCASCARIASLFNIANRSPTVRSSASTKHLAEVTVTGGSDSHPWLPPVTVT